MKLIRPMTINDAALLSSNVADPDYAAWSSSTTYVQGERVSVTLADSHKVYESLQSANTNNSPATSPLWWVEVGGTNRWKMFDQSITSQTSNADSIDCVFQADGYINAVALLNTYAEAARIQVTDSVDGLVYDQTFSLVSGGGITDWWAYFFEPITYVSDKVITDMPMYANSTVQVTLSLSGGTVLCGGCVLGLSSEIGGVQYGASVGIQDYSVKQRDQFGNYTILQRAFSKRATFQILVENYLVDIVQAMLASYRATPIVYFGSDLYSSTIVYGFYKDFSIVISQPSHSVCSLEIEGLT